jgi:hydrogenase expression/formation protein HypC
MCLGVPGRIVAVDGSVATVDFWGVRREVRLDVVDEPVAIGDYVLNHVGYAIRRIPEREIGETLALYELLLREAEREDGGPSGPRADGGPSDPWPDAMAADVRGEIAAAAPPRARRSERGN